ncbi:type II and III secretion system protein family protein [Paraburkholderia caribensis]|uniref:type II and III secretion system protein family protein n=1 Tax=Paraburkholderia caribensis TaxID=75105 RepID=UPI001CB048F7|nr:type II and III secretion system protein family protein [Paraburkholderia caribensis]CAG9193115.1 T2SS-T3SS_pil_N domain-containing protein [Paraburkholderia caribensis]
MRKRILAWRVAMIVCVLPMAARPVASGAADSAGLAPASAAAPVIDLAVGAQQTLAAGRALTRVAVGDPNVADVLILKSGAKKRGGVLLVGKSAGTTSVMLWERDGDAPLTYTVNVTSAAASHLLDGSTAEVRVLGGTAVIQGKAATMEAHQRAASVAAGAAASAGANGKGGGVLDVSSIATRPVVQVDVRVVEFSRAVLKQIGFNFSKGYNGFAFGSFGPSSLNKATFTPGQGTSFDSTMPIASAFNLVFGSVAHNLFADLSLMESNNLARILAEPTLVALSGQSASFLAGGEIPVPVPQGLGTTSIEYKPYGVGLTLTPTVLSPQRIALKVAPEASQLDFVHAVTVNGISVPAITTRRADTTVELGDGESFVIGGLIDRETASNVDKVPVLGDLPILGAFFKQLNYSQSDKELLIIVSPHLVSPLAKGAAMPSTPGEQSEQRDAPVWRSLLGGAASRDAAPGFSK